MHPRPPRRSALPGLNSAALCAAAFACGGGSTGPLPESIASAPVDGGTPIDPSPVPAPPPVTLDLRSLQEIFGVTPLPGDAAHATDLADLFRSFP